MSKKKVLITGAAGNLGFSFIKQYYNTYNIMGSDLKMPSDLPCEVRFQTANISQPEECFGLIEKAYQELGGIDVFVHCGAIAAPGKDQRMTFEVNARGTFYLLQACVECKIKKVVLATSGWVQGLPSSEFLPRKMPLTEDTVGVYKDVYHISKKFNEENGKMHVMNGQIPTLISLRYGGIINIQKEGLKGLATDPFWTRLPTEEAANALACSIEMPHLGFHYFLIGSSFRYNQMGQLETHDELMEKMKAFGYDDMMEILNAHYPGKQTFDHSKSAKVLGFVSKW